MSPVETVGHSRGDGGDGVNGSSSYMCGLPLSQVSGLHRAALGVTTFAVHSSMWRTTPETHPASLWVRTGASLTSTSAWGWPSAPASSSGAASSSRRKGCCGWRGRAPCGRVRTQFSSVLNAHHKSPDTRTHVKLCQLPPGTPWCSWATLKGS